MKSKEFVEILELLFPTLEIVSSINYYNLYYCSCSVGIVYYQETHEQVSETIQKPKFYYPIDFNERFTDKSSYIHDRIFEFHERLSEYLGSLVVKNKLSGQYEPLNITLAKRKCHES